MAITRKIFTSQRLGKRDHQTWSIPPTTNKNALHVNIICHQKGSRRYMKVFEKHAQAMPTKGICDGKRADFQQLVNIYLKRRKQSGVLCTNIQG